MRRGKGKRQTNFGDISEIGVFCAAAEKVWRKSRKRRKRRKGERQKEEGIVRNERQFAFSSNPFSLVIHSPFHSFNLRLSIPFIYEGICLKPS